jgi:hypothetical protein
MQLVPYNLKLHHVIPAWIYIILCFQDDDISVTLVSKLFQTYVQLWESLFVVYFTIVFSETKTSNGRLISDSWIGNDSEESSHGLILLYNPSIRLDGLQKTKKSLRQDSRYPGQHLNLGPPKHEARALTTRPWHSVNYAKEKPYASSY